MATADWIKMRGDIHRDPKVIAIAEFLGARSDFAEWALPFKPAGSVRDALSRAGYECVTIGVTVTALLVTWTVTRRDGYEDNDDMILDHCTPATLDRISGVPGFGAAMVHVGWAAQETETRMRFPKCLIHLTSPEERERKSASERKRRQREKEADAKRDKTVTCHAKVTPRGDNKRSKSPIVPSAAFLEFWKVFPGPRKQDRAKCFELWQSNACEPLGAEIVAHVQAMVRSDKWREQAGRFVPMPATYLRNRRWEDGMPAAAERRVVI